MPELIGAAGLSTVNLAEVLTRLAERGASLPDVRRQIAELGLTIAAFDEEAAVLTAGLRPATRHLGLSLGDRACLALAQREGVAAVTADRAWAGLDLGVQIVLIR